MNYEQLKNSILQEAIEGRLVPQNPSDEPAAVLLRRIREEKARLVKEKKIKKDKNESTIYRNADGHWMERFEDKKRGEVCIDEEVPFEIPESWEWTRIGTVFNQSSGKQQSSKQTLGTPQKFITTSNVYWGYFNLDQVKVMNFTEEEIPRCSATKGDLLVCEGGAGYGRSAIWDKDYDICLQNHVHRLRPYVKGLAEFAFYLMYLLKETNRLTSVGTAMPGLSASRLNSILLPLPPLSEQHRIVSRIEEIMPKVESYGKAQERLDALNAKLPKDLKNSILQEAIEGRLVPQDPKDEPAAVLLQRIREEKARLVKEKKIKKDKNESIIYRNADGHWIERFEDKKRGEVCIDDEIPFEIPESWEWTRLGNLCTFLSRGKSPKYFDEDKRYPVFAQKCNLKEGGISLDQARFLDPSTIDKWPKEYYLRNGDVLINSTGTGTVGRTRLFNEDCLGDYPFVVPDSHVSVVRPYKEISSEYLWFVFSSKWGQKYFEDHLVTFKN